jgi:hypothetical protein
LVFRRVHPRVLVTGCANEAKERWLLLIPRIMPRERHVKREEGAVVEGRHLGPGRPSSLTRGRSERAWRFVATEVGREAGAGRRGATTGVRGYVACSVRGRKHRDRERLPEGLSIAAPPGPGGAAPG